jgi:hypothetical protein
MSDATQIFRQNILQLKTVNVSRTKTTVSLDATTKGPSPLVGESKVSRSENNYFAFIRVLHTNN